MSLYGNMGETVANTNDPAWENRDKVAKMFEEVVKRVCGVAITTAKLKPGRDTGDSKFLKFFKDEFLSYLSYGHPIQEGIVGGHIIVVRGAVIKRDGSEVWAICNDPYGTLVSQDSDYTKNLPTNRDYYYYRGTPGGLSNTRKDRNTPGTGEEPKRRKGQHVYYNDTVHTRTRKNGSGTEFNIIYGRVLPYRSANDISMRRKEYVKCKLLKGK